MRSPWVLLLLLVFAVIMVSSSANAGLFIDTGLVDIPTGAVLEHGVFAVGPYVAAHFDQRNSSADVIAEYLVATPCFHLNFGLFDRVEVGLGYIWNEEGRGEPSTEQAASLKVQLLKEQEVGAVPSIAIGIEYRGDRLLTTDSVMGNSTPSPFLAVSKMFNLPRIHQFSGHIGVGAHRFQFAEGPLGLFVGLSKEFQPAFARGDITLSVEFDGADVNAGMQYITASGLQIGLGAETLNDPDELRYLASVSWTNKHILAAIDETRLLIRRAAELAIAAKRAASEKKSDE